MWKKLMRLWWLLLAVSWVVSASLPSQSASPDCHIEWDYVLHDSHYHDFRSPAGACPTDNQVLVRIRVAQSDITAARLKTIKSHDQSVQWYDLAWDSEFDTDPERYDWWATTIAVGSEPTILYYYFELHDAGNGGCSEDIDYYCDDDPVFAGGGHGRMTDDPDEGSCFQLTVYDSGFAVPEWLQRGVIMQIFPERFRDGNPANNKPAGSYYYGNSQGTIYRSNQTDWNHRICDPRSDCYWIWGENFYGGDLTGVTQKIVEGYFDNLGITILYFNPLFASPSNHGYDTTDFQTVNPCFGTDAEFEDLVAAADGHEIKLILDGVFNHSSSDSIYFDRYQRYDSIGGCEALESPYRWWYHFYADANGACVGEAGPHDYEHWSIFDTLPRFMSYRTQVQQFFWDAALDPDAREPIAPYWVFRGAAGWRFDVAGDIDPGAGVDPNNQYYEGLRQRVREIYPETVLIGEEWQEATKWLLGHEWDSVMNYPLRTAVLCWLFTECKGNGCTESGEVFSDNDNNYNSGNGPFRFITASQFNNRLLTIWEDYPPMAYRAMMNLAGSHDTNRLRFLLRKINDDNDDRAKQRMRELWLFMFTYPGAPTLYYGDEVGLSQDGVWDSGDRTWIDDPYNRAPFPWDDTPGDFTADTEFLQQHVRTMASIRHSYRALQDGDIAHGIVIHDDHRLYGYARMNATQTAVVILNRDWSDHSVTLTGLNGWPYNLPEGTVLVDALTRERYVVAASQLSISVDNQWGVVLLEDAEIDIPDQVGNLTYTATDDDVQLEWEPVTKDIHGGREVVTEYRVHRATEPHFTPDESNLLARITPPAFGCQDYRLSYVDEGAASQTYFYAVCGVNAVDRGSCTYTTRLMDLTLAMPDTYFSPGESCWLQAVITNHGPGVASAVHLFVVLDVLGNYFCYPSWLPAPPIDSAELEALSVGSHELYVLNPFTWPETGDEALYDLGFYGLLASGDLGELFTDVVVWTFGYGPR